MLDHTVDLGDSGYLCHSASLVLTVRVTAAHYFITCHCFRTSQFRYFYSWSISPIQEHKKVSQFFQQARLLLKLSIYRL